MPFQLVRNDITKMQVDAIVNAANSSLLGGGGVDGAIHRAAGPQLLEECRAIRAREGGCPTGEAKITGAGRLPCRYVIHTVGPVWQGGGQGEERLLAACYQNSLALAAQKGCSTVAFPLISAGAYGYPKQQALRVAADTIRAFLQDAGPDEMTVYLVVFDKAAFAISSSLYNKVAAYIDDHYAEQHAEPLEERLRRANLPRQQGAALSGPLEGPAAPGVAGPAAPPPALPSMPPAAAEAHQIKTAKPGRRSALQKLFGLPRQDARELDVQDAQASGAFEEAAPFAESPAAPSEPAPPAAAPAPAAYSAAPAAMPLSAAPRSLDEALECLDESFSEMLLRKIDERGITDAACYKKANISRKLFSKIRSDRLYKPSKPTALAFALALELPMEETKELLMKAGYALSHSSKFDVIVEYFIQNGSYDVLAVNEALFAFDQALLGSA